MKKWIYLTIGILFLISVGGNIVFIMGKGIHVHNNYHQEQYQNQSQTQLVISLFAERGYMKQITKRIERTKVTSFCKTLTAFEYMFKDFLEDTEDDDFVYILYPKIVTNPDVMDPKSDYKPIKRIRR